MTKYVYGRGLIGEEKQDLPFKVYHFDYRGSTAAITDINGNITDRFEYDTYGKLIDHSGSSFVIFGYNGRDGVVTDNNGLIYMRARYYSPELRRFINADVLHGNIDDSTSLNRYAYVNGNPVSFVDPVGLSKERGGAFVDPFLVIADRNESTSIYLLRIDIYGPPNSHAQDSSDGYLKERWFGPDGRAIRDRHHTDHGSKEKHPNPHDQDWDWTNPEHPRLKDPYPPKDESNNEPSDDGVKAESSAASSGNAKMFWTGVGMIVLSTIGLLWLAGNDFTGVGIADNVAIVPLVETFRQGSMLVATP